MDECVRRQLVEIPVKRLTHHVLLLLPTTMERTPEQLLLIQQGAEQLLAGGHCTQYWLRLIVLKEESRGVKKKLSNNVMISVL